MAKRKPRRKPKREPAFSVELEWTSPEGDELFKMVKQWVRLRYGRGS